MFKYARSKGAKYEPAVRIPVINIGVRRSGNLATSFPPNVSISTWVRSRT